MDTLAKSRPHYIRCIKPNDQKRSGLFQDALNLHQVRSPFTSPPSCGVSRALRLARVIVCLSCVAWFAAHFSELPGPFALLI